MCRTWWLVSTCLDWWHPFVPIKIQKEPESKFKATICQNLVVVVRYLCPGIQPAELPPAETCHPSHRLLSGSGHTTGRRSSHLGQHLSQSTARMFTSCHLLSHPTPLHISLLHRSSSIFIVGLYSSACKTSHMVQMLQYPTIGWRWLKYAEMHLWHYACLKRLMSLVQG